VTRGPSGHRTVGHSPEQPAFSLAWKNPRADATRLATPLTTHDSPLTTHHSRLTTHDSPLTTHHSRLTTHRNLPQRQNPRSRPCRKRELRQVFPTALIAATGLKARGSQTVGLDARQRRSDLKSTRRDRRWRVRGCASERVTEYERVRVCFLTTPTPSHSQTQKTATSARSSSLSTVNREDYIHGISGIAQR